MAGRSGRRPSAQSLVAPVKPDAPAGSARRLQEKQQLLIEIPERSIMLEQCFINFGQAPEDCGVGCNPLTQTDEGANDEDTHMYRSLATEDVGGHQRAMLGKGPGAIRCATMAAGTGHKL